MTVPVRTSADVNASVDINDLQAQITAGKAENRILYVGKHGNDSNDGTNIGIAKLTYGSALTVASALTPTSGSRVVIVTQDSGTYTEDITMVAFVDIYAPNATLSGDITRDSDAQLLTKAQKDASTVEPNIDYTSSGNDVLLTEPDGSKSTASIFVPMVDDSATPPGTGDLLIDVGNGNNQWKGNNKTAGTSTTFASEIGSASWGEIEIIPGDGTNWALIASAANNGVQTISLPKDANGDTTGGSTSYYFNSAAFTNAFNGNILRMRISQDNNVYAGAIAPENLVTKLDGTIGQAGLGL